MDHSDSWLTTLVGRQVVVNHWIVATLLRFDETSLHLEAEGGPLVLPRDRVLTISPGPPAPPRGRQTPGAIA